MQTDPKNLTTKHEKLTHSEELKVLSHSQREKDEWFINSIMIEGCDVPFKYKRNKKYKQLLKGQNLNLTYYPEKEMIAGLEFEFMKVVRIKRS